MPPRKRPTADPFDGPARPETEATRLRDWQAKVARAVEIRRDWETRFRVEEGEQFFLGQQTPQPDQLALNHFWATLKTQLPSLFYATPKFYVKPKPGQAGMPEMTGRIGEGVLQTISDQDQNLKRAGKLALLQAFFRIGVLKVCYQPTMLPNPVKGEPMQAQGRPLANPRTGQAVLEPDEILADDVYRFEWVDACSMLLPDEGPDMARWSWIGEEVVVPLEDAKEDPRFDRTLRARLRANESQPGRPDRLGMRRPMPPESKGFLRYIECYDIRKRKLLLWAEGQRDRGFLVEDDLPEGVEDHPYAILPGFTPILGPEPSPWPVPHVHAWVPVQREYNIRRQQITEGCKRSARKVAYDDSTFADADEAVKALDSPKDMEAFKVVDVNRVPVILGDKSINPDIWRDVPFLQADWRIITGQSGARLQSPDSDTATEATFVERAANVRDADLMGDVNDWLATAGKKMLQRVRQTLTLDVWIRMRELSDTDMQKYIQQVYGMPEGSVGAMLQILPGLKEVLRERFGQEKPLRVSREQLAFEADVSVVPGSSRPRNLEVERAQWLNFLRVIGQFPQLALSRELLRETASKFEYISDRMLDELTALAKTMIDVNARQAGRTQGGENGAAGGQAGLGQQMVPALMQALGGMG